MFRKINLLMSFLRILLAFAYFSTLPCLFLAIYFGKGGITIGLCLTFLTLLFVVTWFHLQLKNQLRLEKLSYRDFPFLFEEIQRCAHLLSLPTPKLWVLKKPHLNAGHFGYFKGDRHFFFTQGVLTQLPNAELSSLVSALMAKHSFSSASLHCYAVALLFPFSDLLFRRDKSFLELTTQFFVISFLYIPLRLLKPSFSQREIDKKALSLYPHPFLYGKLLRRFSREGQLIAMNEIERALGLVAESPFSVLAEEDISILKRIQGIEGSLYG